MHARSNMFTRYFYLFIEKHSGFLKNGVTPKTTEETTSSYWRYAKPLQYMGFRTGIGIQIVQGHREHLLTTELLYLGSKQEGRWKGSLVTHKVTLHWFTLLPKEGDYISFTV